MKYVLIFCCLVSISFSTSILNNREFYINYSEALTAGSRDRLIGIIDDGVIDIWKDPRYKKLLLSAESKGLFQEFLQFKTILNTVVDFNLLKEVEDKRYFYMRESIRRVARSSIDTSVEKAVAILIESDLIAVLVDSQFRSIVEPLIESGYLKKYFSMVGDLVFFEQDLEFKKKWDVLFKRYQKINYDSDAKIISLMEIIADGTELMKNKARNIRDSGFYEAILSKREKLILKSSLYEIYNSYIRDPRWVEAIQTLSQKKLLFPAIEAAEMKAGEYFKRLLRKKTASKDTDLSLFFRSRSFQEFTSSSTSPDYFFLSEEGVLSQMIKKLDDIAILLKYSKTPQFEKSKMSLSLKQKKTNEDTKIRLTKVKNSDSCYENMKLMMSYREKFSLKMRKDVLIKTEDDRSEFFKESGLQRKICASGGKYLSSKYGRIQCTYHGDAPISSKK